MNRRDFMYRVGMTGASLPFLNATAATAPSAKAKSVIYIFLVEDYQYDSFNVEVDAVLGKSTIIKVTPTGFGSVTFTQSWPGRWINCSC